MTAWRALFLDRDARRQRTLVILSQVYVPDPASVGQHMHDVAAEMARRGLRVIVFTADRGYDDPARRYPRYEVLDGVHVLRLPWSSFGKSSIPIRLLGGGVFVCEATLLAAALPRIDRVLVSTSPPMCALSGIALKRLRGAALTFWAMDINPDQIVASGKLTSTALPVRALEWMNRETLREAEHIVALDRFMAERLRAKHGVADKISVLPPWPHVDQHGPALVHCDNPFRIQHGLQGKFVVMYSGNLSPVHPITTVLDAARRLQHDPRLSFVFVGGGAGRSEVERYASEYGLRNVLTIPYQPLAALPHSLSAADVHVVSMGDDMVGIVHPCKIYGAMAVGRPVLVLGPRRSHLGEIVSEHDIGFQVEHGDVAGVERALRRLVEMRPEELALVGRRARAAVDAHYARRALLARFCDLLAGPVYPGEKPAPSE